MACFSSVCIGAFRHFIRGYYGCSRFYYFNTRGHLTREAKISQISYTLYRVIPTLAMIESESPPDYINIEPLLADDADDPNKDPEDTSADGASPFITSSFRKTFRVLQFKGTYRAGLFRGFTIYYAHGVATHVIPGIFKALPVLRLLPFEVTVVITSVICAQLSLGWTLIVISKPSRCPWYRRIPSFEMWKKIAGPTAFYAVAEQASIMLPVYLALGSIESSPNSSGGYNLPERIEKSLIFKGVGISALGLVLAIAVIIPARVILTRMQASLISQSEETIVPFDRSFGGKVSDNGMIGILDAWKTFDWAARRRLMKVYLKVFGILIGVILFFSGLIWCEMLVMSAFA